jgi:hypothetical protein
MDDLGWMYILPVIIGLLALGLGFYFGARQPYRIARDRGAPPRRAAGDPDGLASPSHAADKPRSNPAADRPRFH